MRIDAERELGAHLADQLDGDVRRTGDRHAQGVQVERLATRVVEDRPVDGGSAGQHRDPLLLHQRQHRGDVEHRDREDRGALEQAREPPRLVPEHVEERVHDQVAVAGPEAGELAPLAELPHGLAVGHDHALGAPRRAGREEDVARVGRSHALPPRRRRGGGDRLAALGEGVPGLDVDAVRRLLRAGRSVEEHDPAQVGEGRAGWRGACATVSVSRKPTVVTSTTAFDADRT